MSTLSLAAVHCAGCHNTFYVRDDEEFVPSYCCYCGAAVRKVAVVPPGTITQMEREAP